jgi:hypothetical protein
MKTTQITKLVLCCLMAAPVFCGCNEENGNDNDIPILIYAKGDDGNITRGQIVHTSSGMHYMSLHATFLCNATREVPSGETVRFSVDSALVAGYNEEYHTEYRIAPKGSYEFSHDATAVIPSGTLQSTDTVALNITKPEIFEDGTYLIPVKLTPETQQLSVNFGVVYVIIQVSTGDFRGADSVTGKTVDPAGQGWTATADKGYGDISDILSNYAYGYWYSMDFPTTITINFNRSQTLKGLMFTSVYAEYGFRRISLAVSNDSTTWKSLSTQDLLEPVVEYGFSQQYVEFFVPVTTQYLQLVISSPWDGGFTLLSKFSIIVEN